MKSLIHVVMGHPYLVLLASGLLERIGFPLLFSPVLVGAGALAAAGKMRLDVAVWLALITCIVGDTAWYELGRKKGDSVLSLLCRISFEPDTCVRRSKIHFEKSASRTLFFSKWLPGVSHIVPAVAGLSGIERDRFFTANVAGSMLWIIVLVLTGYLPVENAEVFLGININILLGSAVLVEVVFTRPGVGRLIVEGIISGDFQMVQVLIMFYAGSVVIINLLVDITYSLVDPRIVHK